MSSAPSNRGRKRTAEHDPDNYCRCGECRAGRNESGRVARQVFLEPTIQHLKPLKLSPGQVRTLVLNHDYDFGP